MDIENDNVLLPKTVLNLPGRKDFRNCSKMNTMVNWWWWVIIKDYQKHCIVSYKNMNSTGAYCCPPPCTKAGDVKTHSSICLSVTKTLTRLISSEVIEHWYFACMIDVLYPCDKSFQLAPCRDLDLSSTSRSIVTRGGGVPQFSKFAWYVLSVCSLSSLILAEYFNHMRYRLYTCILHACFTNLTLAFTFDIKVNVLCDHDLDIYVKIDVQPCSHHRHSYCIQGKFCPYFHPRTQR